MSARVQEESVYVAACADCDWYSEPYEEESDADQAAVDHNDENHGGDQ